jgi:hypothetical protein
MSLLILSNCTMERNNSSFLLLRGNSLAEADQGMTLVLLLVTINNGATGVALVLLLVLREQLDIGDAAKAVVVIVDISSWYSESSSSSLS